MNRLSRARISPRAVVDQRDLFLVALGSGAAIASVLLGLPTPVRIFFAVPLVLFLPGYALVAALLPGLVIPGVERILLAMGTSLALAVVAGLALAASPAGLSAVGWSLILGLPTLIIVFVAWFRRIRKSQPGPGFNIASMPRSQALMVIVAALIVVNVVLVTRLNATEAQSPPPLTLWMVPVENRPDNAIIGVRAGPAAGNYRLAISVAGDLVYEFSLDLEPSETWEQRLTFGGTLRQKAVVARLYEGDSATEIRYVVLQPAPDAT